MTQIAVPQNRIIFETMLEAVVTPDVITFSLLMASLSLELSPLRMEEARKHGDGSDSNALGKCLGYLVIFLDSILYDITGA